MVHPSVEALIGETPLVELHRLQVALSLPSRILAKLEGWNPGGSAKDRAAQYMLNDGETRGLLHPDTVIIEPTSGNTGIALAMLGALRGYRVIIVMPETVSEERSKLVAAYGAQVERVSGNMQACIARAQELAAGFPRAWIPGQFENPANPKAHFCTTGPEVYEAVGGRLDAFVAGVGTGGTITGVGGYLKMRNPAIRVVAVEPADSPVLSGGAAGPHELQGIGPGFVPQVLRRELIDEVLKVTTGQAKDMARLLAETEGLLVGISSGAALYGAAVLAGRMPGQTIAVLLPDRGERYLSTELFA